MSPKNQKKLINRYPKIFRLVKEPDQAPFYPISLFSIECDDGWYNIIDQLCANIQHHIDSSVEHKEWDEKWNRENPEKARDVRDVVPQVVAMQVKEKYGTLRFYYNGGDKVIDGMLRMAESMSAVTCEQCGKPGKIRGFGWVYTACNEHTKPEHLCLGDENEQ